MTGTHDPEIKRLIEAERRRQAATLSLVASESLASVAARDVQRSILTQKLGEGYPGRRYCTGAEVIDKIEAIACARARTLFGADHANVQPYSGTFANIAVFLGLLQQGEGILAMHPAAGGHHSHGEAPHLTSRFWKVSFYSVDPKTGLLNYDAIRDQARAERPRLIIAGASFYPRAIDYPRFGEICNEVGAYFLADIAHVAGLIAATLHSSPVPWADAVTSSTHKTLGGPRGGGVILCKARHADTIDRAVWPGLQGAPLLEMIAARAIVFREAATDAFRDLQRRVIENARALADGLLRRGATLQTGGTDTHLMILQLTPFRMTGADAERHLADRGLTSNKLRLSNGEEALRLGTIVATQRGLGPVEMDLLADLIVRALRKEDSARDGRRALRDLLQGRPLVAPS
jgi:glycine hydroxymethyltransferase